MIISGLQKLTLLDFPNKMACIIFLGGCNFRCPFCHNASLVTKNLENNYSKTDIFEYLLKRKKILQGAVITGGEPLINDDLRDFLMEIKSLGYQIKLDTNGSFPDKLEAYVDEKLIDYVAMDIKNSPQKYQKTCGCAVDFDKIKESIYFLLTGKVDYEFRTTVTKEFHEKQDFVEIAKYIGGAKRYYLQKFKDSGDLIGNNNSAYSDDEMNEFAKIFEGKVETVEVR